MNEADTCRRLITPKLQAAGWDADPHSIAEQHWFTPGRIVVRGHTAERRLGKRADHLLRYTRDFPIAVVEAKSDDEHAAKVVEDHRWRGKPLAVWSDGKAVWIPVAEAGALHEAPTTCKSKSYRTNSAMLSANSNRRCMLLEP
jgi:hypothetical protein